MKAKYFLPLLLLLNLNACSTHEKITPGQNKTAAGEMPRGFDKWVQGNRISVHAVDPATGGATVWRYEILGPGDARIISESRGPKGTQLGTVYLYGGRLMAAKNVPIKPGFESHAVDYPAMVVNLVFELLSRGVPEGPGGFSGEKVIDVSGTNNIVVATDSAYAMFGAPWSLRGKALRGDGNAVAFELIFAYADGRGEGSFAHRTLRGEWAIEEEIRQLDPGMRLSGYDVFLLGPGPGAPGRSRLAAERLTNLTTVADAFKLIESRDAIEEASAKRSK